MKMKHKINLEELFSQHYVNGELEMGYKSHNTKDQIVKQVCLMNLKDHIDDYYIELYVKNLNVPKNSNLSAVDFVQWWLDFIKDSICSLYNAVISSHDNTKITIFIRANSKVDKFVRFTNYELIRYLVGVKFNMIPGIVYNLMEWRRKYFENDIEIFYYALYMLEIFNVKTDNVKTNKVKSSPNYTWHLHYIINIKDMETISFPVCIKPVDYNKATSNFGYLQSLLSKEESTNLNTFNLETNRPMSSLWKYNLSSEERIKTKTKIYSERLNKFINPVNIKINNIYGFKKSLLSFRQMCNPKNFKNLIPIQNEKPQTV
jgi:hypothetical protein